MRQTYRSAEAGFRENIVYSAYTVCGNTSFHIVHIQLYTLVNLRGNILHSINLHTWLEILALTHFDKISLEQIPFLIHLNLFNTEDLVIICG